MLAGIITLCCRSGTIDLVMHILINLGCKWYPSGVYYNWKKCEKVECRKDAKPGEPNAFLTGCVIFLTWGCTVFKFMLLIENSYRRDSNNISKLPTLGSQLWRSGIILPKVSIFNPNCPDIPVVPPQEFSLKNWRYLRTDT